MEQLATALYTGRNTELKAFQFKLRCPSRIPGDSIAPHNFVFSMLLSAHSEPAHLIYRDQ